MSKKKLKIKKRRNLSQSEFAPKKEVREIMLKDWMIRQAIPDPDERQKYIEGLIEALDVDILKGLEDE